MCVKKEKIKEIYIEAFGNEDNGFCDRLFDSCFEYCCTLEIKGETVAMLFALPSEVIIKGKAYQSYYVFAVATKKEHRGKGYMSKLLEEIKKENKILFLKPVNKGVIEFYKKNGFKEFTATTFENKDLYAVPLEEFKAFSSTEGEKRKYTYTAMQYGSKLSLDNMYFPFIME